VPQAGMPEVAIAQDGGGIRLPITPLCAAATK
jgi:hypothetical protein